MVDWVDMPQELMFAEGTVTAVILGIMQDGGLPHVGCRCGRCVAAFNEPEKVEYAACLGLVDTRGTSASSVGTSTSSVGTSASSVGTSTSSVGTSTKPVLSQPKGSVGAEPVEAPTVTLIDATPDIKYQINLLAHVLGSQPEQSNRLRQPDGIFLTHAHMGHIGGLPQLGPEVMDVDRLPVYASSELGYLLQATPLWSPVVENLRIVGLRATQYVELAADVKITAVPVPHRDELGTGTFAFKIQGPNRSLLYLPDIDRWDEWPEAEAMLSSVDVAVVDASFYSVEELNGRSPVAHPLIPDTLKRFAKLECELVLTHLNHTNPVLDSDSQARFLVNAAGVQVAQTGQMFTL